MAIKVKPRALVEAEVAEAYRLAAANCLAQIHEQIQCSRREMRVTLLKKHRGALARLTPIARGKSGAGSGLDLEISRLRALDFARICVAEFPFGIFLAATTHDLIMEEMGEGRGIIAAWDVGPYSLYIPVADLGFPRINRLHFVPERLPATLDRHPHHYTRSSSAHYLSGDPVTCWSQFATPMTNAMQEANLPEILRLGRTFAGRYYRNSPLRRPDSSADMQKFMRRLP